MTTTELTCECGAKFVTRYQSKYVTLCYECRRKKRLAQSREWKRVRAINQSGAGIEKKIVKCSTCTGEMVYIGHDRCPVCRGVFEIRRVTWNYDKVWSI